MDYFELKQDCFPYAITGGGNFGSTAVKVIFHTSQGTFVIWYKVIFKNGFNIMKRLDAEPPLTTPLRDIRCPEGLFSYDGEHVTDRGIKVIIINGREQKAPLEGVIKTTPLKKKAPTFTKLPTGTSINVPYVPTEEKGVPMNLNAKWKVK